MEPVERLDWWSQCLQEDNLEEKNKTEIYSRCMATKKTPITLSSFHLLLVRGRHFQYRHHNNDRVKCNRYRPTSQMTVCLREWYPMTWTHESGKEKRSQSFPDCVWYWCTTVFLRHLKQSHTQTPHRSKCWTWPSLNKIFSRLPDLYNDSVNQWAQQLQHVPLSLFEKVSLKWKSWLS